MAWLWIIVAPLALGVAFAGYCLAFVRIAKSMGFDTSTDSFPLWPVGSFVALAVLLVQIFDR